MAHGTGTTHIAYGSVGPRPVLFTDDTGILADPASSDFDRREILERAFAGASPSPRSMRASPDYRLAMLSVLGERAVATAVDRLVRG